MQSTLGHQLCNFNFQLCHACLYSFNLFLEAFSDLKIRLINGASNKTGRVEIFHPSFGWGTACDDGWGDTESAVVCRQLGFAGMNETRGGAIIMAKEVVPYSLTLLAALVMKNTSGNAIIMDGKLINVVIVKMLVLIAIDMQRLIVDNRT